MSLKQYKPITSSQRGLVLVDRTELHKGKPLKNSPRDLLNLVVEIILVI